MKMIFWSNWWNEFGRGNRSTRRKPAPGPLCPPQNPSWRPGLEPQTAVVGSQRLTAWAMARPIHGLDVDSVNSSSNYLAYLCIPASETTLHQKRMSGADRSHFSWKNVETNCKNELPSWIVYILYIHIFHISQVQKCGCKEWITVVLQSLSFSNCVALLALDFNTPVPSARCFSYFQGVCSSLAPVSSNLSSVSTRQLCFCFLSIKSPVDLSCELSACRKLFHHEIYVQIFTETF
jgi:hypothetical protein